MEYAFSSDWTQVEMKAPYRGFLNNITGEPIIQFGMKINVAFILEVSGEYSVPPEWATDGSWPIRGYEIESSADANAVVIAPWAISIAIIGCIVGSSLVTLGVVLFIFRRSKGYKAVK